MNKTTSAHSSTNQANRIDYLDGWRGLAILLVLASHFLQLKEIDVGRLGVDLFFVLSGMLMADILFIKKTDLRTFFKRRFSRIFPVFLIFIGAVYLGSYLFTTSDEHSNVFYTAMFLRSYFPDEPNIWNTGLPLNHLWSLNVEEHTYILLALLTIIPLLKHAPCATILALGGMAIVLQYLYVRFPSIATPRYDLRTEVNASLILLSAGYALFKHRIEHLIPGWLPIATLAASLICYSQLSPHWTAKWAIAPPLLAFTINHLNLTPAYFQMLLSIKPLRFIGLWSFSIYLWQEPLSYYFVERQDTFSTLGFALLAISIMIGAASFYMVENPARRFLNKRW